MSAPTPDTAGSRLDRIEAAIGAALNINLADFDGQDVQAARASRLAAAADTAAELVKEAFTEQPLTVEQRLARIEKALASRGSF